MVNNECTNVDVTPPVENETSEPAPPIVVNRSTSDPIVTDDGGIPGIVWILILLGIIFIAIAGVYYWETQKKKPAPLKVQPSAQQPAGT